MFFNCCKQTFHISQACISQRKKRRFNVKSSAYYFYMKKILPDFPITISVICISVALSHTLLKLMVIVLAKVAIKVFFNTTWSHDQCITWLHGLHILTLNHKSYSKSNRTLLQKYVCITYYICITYIFGANLCYKLGQLILLQIRANVVENWGSFVITIWGKCCYKLGQLLQVREVLLQNRAAITNWGKMYYKLRQVLQIRSIITNRGLTVAHVGFVMSIFNVLVLSNN